MSKKANSIFHIAKFWIVFVVLIGLIATPNMVKSQQNLLVNGEFSSAGARQLQQSIYEPAGWQFSYDVVPDQYGLYWGKIWGKWSGLENGYDGTEYLWFWGANSVGMYLDLAQDVNGLDTNQEYYVDIAMSASIRDWANGYALSRDEVPIDMPIDTFLCINVFSATTGEMLDTTGWVDPSSANGIWQRFGLTFVPSEPNIRVVINYWAPYGHNFNSVYFDDARLYAKGNAPVTEPTAISPTPVQPAAISQPTTAPEQIVPAQSTAISQPTADYTAVSLQQTATSLAVIPTATLIAPEVSVTTISTATPAVVSNVLADELFSLPTPNANNEMIYTVESGDTLARIARLACGNATTCVETLRTLNALTTDVLQVGQTLVIGPLADNLVQDAQLTTVAPQEPMAEEPVIIVIPTSTPVPTAVPVIEAEDTALIDSEENVPKIMTGDICLSVYEDLDGNGVKASEEPNLSGFRLRIVDEATRSILGETVSDASTMPHCFTSLSVGTYSVRVILDQNSTATTNPEFEATVQADSTMTIGFGISTAIDKVDTANGVLDQVVGWVISIVLVGSIFLGFGGLAVLQFMRRIKRVR